MMSQGSQQTIAIHILPNISRSYDNQIMKSGQLIENIFLQKNCLRPEKGTLMQI